MHTGQMVKWTLPLCFDGRDTHFHPLSPHPRIHRPTRALVLLHPLLLAVPSSNLSYKIDEIMMVLDLSKGAAVKKLASNPTLALRVSSMDLRQRIDPQ